MKSKRTRALLVAAAAVSGAGRLRHGRLPARHRHRFVVDATEADIVAKIGKPDRIDAADSSAPRWVYTKKTFDPDNMNRTDEETIVVLKNDAATGALEGAEVLFLLRPSVVLDGGAGPHTASASPSAFGPASTPALSCPNEKGPRSRAGLGDCLSPTRR